MPDSDSVETTSAPAASAGKATPKQAALRASFRDQLMAKGADLPEVSAPAEAPDRSTATEATEETALEADTAEPANDNEPAEVANDNQADKLEPEQHDKDTARRLAIVAKSEKRAKEALRVERAQIAEERATLEATRKAHQAAVSELEQFAKQAKRDPWGLLRHLGATEDDADHIAQAIYLNSKAGAADPARRRAVEAEQSKRAEQSRVEQLEREIAEMKQTATSREKQASDAQAVNAYLDGVAKAVTDEHPLTKAVLAKNPTKARNALHAIAAELAAEYDDAPDAEDVLAAYEKQRAAELEELGIDPATIGKVAATGSAKTPSKTLGSLSSSTVPKNTNKMTQEQLRADARKRVQSGQLD